MLLQNGADVSISNHEEKIPFTVAAKYTSFPDFLCCLLQLHLECHESSLVKLQKSLKNVEDRVGYTEKDLASVDRGLNQFALSHTELADAHQKLNERCAADVKGLKDEMSEFWPLLYKTGYGLIDMQAKNRRLQKLSERQAAKIRTLKNAAVNAKRRAARRAAVLARTAHARADAQATEIAALKEAVRVLTDAVGALVQANPASGLAAMPRLFSPFENVAQTPAEQVKLQSLFLTSRPGVRLCQPTASIMRSFSVAWFGTSHILGQHICKAHHWNGY